MISDTSDTFLVYIYIYLQSRVAFKVACTTFITPFHRNYTKKGHEVRCAMSQRWVFCPGNVKASLAFHIPSGLCCMLQYLSHPQSPWYFFIIHWIRSKNSICSFRMSIKFMHYIHHLSYNKVYLYTVLFEGLNFQPANQSMAPILGAETAAADHQNTRVEVKVLWNCHSCHTSPTDSWRVRAQNRDFGK